MERIPSTPVLQHSNTPTLLSFEIEDTGPGIAPEEIESLFKAFVQTSTGREAQEGTGLGLPISRKFVQLMGDDISVRSQVGKGTLFTFKILVDLVDQSTIDNRQSTIPKRVIALAPNQPCYRILVVDDKWDNRRLLIKLLNPLGFELREAENGQEALEIWETWEPHLIWMDMRMPVMDGYEATKRIKATTKGQVTAIIAVTASSFEEERAVVLSAGCDDFLRKPFRDAEIFDIMQKLLGVQYMYEEGQKAESREQKAEGKEGLTPEALAVLPVDLIEDLKKAILIANPDHIPSLLDRIGELDAPLAKALRRKIEDFEYREILKWLEQH